MDASSALVCFQPRTEPQARLICFPHAGGGPHAFSELGSLFPDWIEVHVVSYAGRGQRFAEAFPTRFEQASSEAYAAIREVADRPISLLGHSFGALLALDCAVRLVADGATLLRLFTSSCTEPRYAAQYRGPMLRMSELSDAALVTELASRGWLPAAASGGGSAGLLAHALPPLRADLRLYEQYKPPASCPPMRVTALGGERDASVPLEALEAWRVWTAAAGDDDSAFSVCVVNAAGHFHVESHSKELAARLETSFRESLDRLPSSVLVGPTFEGDDRKTILDVFEQLATADDTKSLPAISEPSADDSVPSLPPLPFEKVRALSRTVAKALLQRGVGPETVVAVYLPPCTGYCVANLGIFYAKAAMVYFEVNYTTALIDQLLDASGAKCVLTNSTLRTHLPDRCCTDSPSVLLIETTDGLAWSFEQWGTGSWAADEHPAGRCLLESNSLAYCSMSSGTTGKPKAILVEHRSVYHNYFCRDAVYPYQDDETADGCNIFFVWEALRAPLHGRLVVIIPDTVVVDARRLVSFLKKHKITRCMLTPSLLRNVLDQPGLDARRMLGNLKYLLLEGEVVPRSLVNDFQNRFYSDNGGDYRESQPWRAPVLVNYYSTWESLDATASRLVPPEASMHGVLTPASFSVAPVGRPLPGICVLIMERATGRVVPRGVPGFVFVLAATVARGYLADLEKTKSRFLKNPLSSLAEADRAVRVALAAQPRAVDKLLQDPRVRCYDTGDRGVALSDGTLVLLGRADSTVKIRGFKVALEYVRTTALESLVVRSCVVRPVLDVATQQPIGLVAYFVPTGVDAGRAKVVAALRDHFKNKLPEYAVPSHIVALASLPTKPGSGKLDYSLLPPPTDPDAGVAAVAASASSGAAAAPQAQVGGSSFRRLASREILAAFQATLNREDIARDANFFELGGHSLHAAKIVGLVAERLGIEIAVADLFERPSVEALAAMLAERRDMPAGEDGGGIEDASLGVDAQFATNALGMTPMAVTGAACLLPGARDVSEFWRNLSASHDSLSEFSLAALAARRVPQSVLANPDFVPKGQMIGRDEVVSFDAFFWGISASEARVMDPQHRKLLEAAWRAREAAARGYRISPLDGSYGDDDAGVFAASGIDGYMIHHLRGAPLLDIADPGAVFVGEVGSEKDYAPTRISYQLGLRGPSVAINSACSSALVAAAVAVHAVTVGECRAAIVGASSITFPNLGYVYVDGLVGSRDGTVRPLDASASGTLFGDGVGAFCLEALDANIPVAPEQPSRARLRPALAVVLGVAVTNDGRLKAGFTAPSADAQALALSRSTRRARVPRLDYLELHATATKLGDAIEMAGVVRSLKALNASGITTEPTPSSVAAGGTEVSSATGCLLGSVKGNIGHANCAAGLTGLLKACLTITHAMCPPTAHFSKLNPKIAALPPHALVVAHGAGPQPLAGSQDDDDTRRFFGGVSSFGVGGTNAHLTLASPPAQLDAARGSGGYYGEVTVRRRHRTKHPRTARFFWRHGTDDHEMPHGAAAKPALASEAADAAAFAAMRDAAAEAAVAAGLDRARARRRALQAVRHLDHLKEEPDGENSIGTTSANAQNADAADASADTSSQSAAATLVSVFSDVAPAARPIARVNSLDALVGVADETERHHPVAIDTAVYAAPPPVVSSRKTNKNDPSICSAEASLPAVPHQTARKRGRPKRRRAEVVAVSSKSEASLRESVAKIASFMRKCVDDDEDVYLSDVAKTLQEGREHFREWRVAISASTLREAADALERATPVQIAMARKDEDVVCLEIGTASGALTLGAGHALFETHADFRSRLQACAAVLDEPLKQLPTLGAVAAPAGLLDALGYSIDQADFRPDKAATFSAHGRSSLINARAVLARPAVAQPATFALLYSLAACMIVDETCGDDENAATGPSTDNTVACPSNRRRQRLVLRTGAPFFVAIAGRGVGQLVALALDGGIALDDALLLCCERGRLLEEEPAKAALLLERYVSSRLDDRVAYIRPPTRAAITDNVSGAWLTSFDVKDASYWGAHLSAEVAPDESMRWSENTNALERYEPTIVISVNVVGLSKTDALPDTMHARHHSTPRVTCDASSGDASDQRALSDALAAAWCAGLQIDWPAARLSARGHTSLAREAKFVAGVPGYSFAKTTYWVNPTASIYADDEIVNTAAHVRPPATLLAPPPSRFVVVKRSQVRQAHDPRARLVCVPFAGGSSAAFGGAWLQAAPPWLEIAAIELAGRGARSDEPLPNSDADDFEQRKAIREAVVAYVGSGDLATPPKPWGLIGLSAGALPVLELYDEMCRVAPTNLAARRALDALRFVCIAGRAPPRLDLGDEPPAVPDDAEIIDVYALVPPETRVSAAFCDIALPRLRADLGADARAELRIATKCPRVGVPVVVLGGLEDPSFPVHSAQRWQDLLRPTSFKATFFQGGHQFLVDRSANILEEIAPLLAPTEAEVGALRHHQEVAIENQSDESVLYTVRWEQAALVQKGPVGDQVPTTRLCDVVRVLREGDEEILEEAATYAARTGSLLVDGLVGSIDDDETSMAWLDRDEEEAWAMVRLLQAVSETETRPIEVVLVCRASVRGALAAGATKCARYELGSQFIVRRVYVKLTPGELDAATADGTRDDLVRRLACQDFIDEDVLLMPRRSGWRAAVPRARPIHKTLTDEVAESEAAAWLPTSDNGESIMVTGATGGLGRALVTWLESVCEARLVLVGRTEPKVKFWQAPSVFAAATVDSLESLEASIGQESDIGAVFHLAGVLRDATLGTLDRDKFAAPIAPKARGIVAIRELAARKKWPVKAIVAYSSTTSLYGFGGQTNYAAANALLDAFADFGDDKKPSLRPPVVSIHWGPWGEAGMAALGSKASDLALRFGDAPLSTRVGLTCLGMVLGASPGRFAAFSIADWARSPWNHLPATRHLLKRKAATDESQPHSDESQNEDARADLLSDDLVDSFLHQHVSTWLPDATLDTLGLDSLDLAQMRAKAAELAGKSIPMAIFAAPDRKS